MFNRKKKLKPKPSFCPHHGCALVESTHTARRDYNVMNGIGTALVAPTMKCPNEKGHWNTTIWIGEYTVKSVDPVCDEPIDMYMEL